MDHNLWETYCAISRKIETGGRNNDGNEDPGILAEQQRFIDIFKQHLPPTRPDGQPTRILAPGAISEALLLAKAGYETHAMVLGPDNLKWLQDRRGALPRPELLVPREHDAHDLREYPEGFFDGNFSIQFHEHLISPYVYVGEVRHTVRTDGIVWVDAAGTTNPAMRMIWHTNLVPAQQVREQFEYWGFQMLWEGPHGDDRPQFIFKRLADNDINFTNRGYIQHITRLRRGQYPEYPYFKR